MAASFPPDSCAILEQMALELSQSQPRAAHTNTDTHTDTQTQPHTYQHAPESSATIPRVGVKRNLELRIRIDDPSHSYECSSLDEITPTRSSISEYSPTQTHIQTHTSLAGMDGTAVASKRRRSLPARLVEPVCEAAASATKPTSGSTSATPAPGSASGLKRPRGRPPLSGGRGRASPFGRSGGRGRIPGRGSSSSESLSEKTKVASPEQITSSLISTLMTEDPLSLSEVVRTLPDVSKDSIVSILDVLQVLGLVIQLEKKDKTSAGPFFALTDFARTPESADIRKLTSAVQAKEDSAAATRQRIDRLKALSEIQCTKTERRRALSELMCDLLGSDSKLQHDPLYRHLMDELGVETDKATH